MPEFHERLRELRKLRGLSQQKLADKLSKSKSSINMYERGEREPGLPMIKDMADFFGVDTDYLLGISDIPRKSAEGKLPENLIPIPDEPVIQIPVIGRVAAGTDCIAEVNIIDYEPVFRSEISPLGKYVYLQVKGDSMSPNLEDGDIVLVQCQNTVDSGSIAVVIIDNEDGVVKRIVYGGDYIELRSVNSDAYPPRRFEGKDIDRVRIFGLVKESKRKF